MNFNPSLRTVLSHPLLLGTLVWHNKLLLLLSTPMDVLISLDTSCEWTEFDLFELIDWNFVKVLQHFLFIVAVHDLFLIGNELL